MGYTTCYSHLIIAMSHTYEVEIKSLLGSKGRADELRQKLFKKDPKLSLVSEGKQLNHYFNTPVSLQGLHVAMLPLIPEEKKESFARVVKEGKNVSIRTRISDGNVTFIMKSSVGDDTSANGVSRIEFEAEVQKTLDELDKVLLDAGLTYQAKWSRERQEYKSNDMHITIDKNAGYGYLAEFERLVDDRKQVEEAKKDLLNLMDELGVEELSQDRLERMFAHYNRHWAEYYGTDKMFVIE